MNYYLIAIYTVATIAAILLLAHNPITPILGIIFKDVPNKFRIVISFIGIWLKSLFVIIPDILAPIIVPIALLFTKWEDEKLPKLFALWDNDASINGDKRTDDPNDGRNGWNLKFVPLEKDSEEAINMCYWAQGHHPRSFYARWVWLGLRNRASNASVMLGKQPDYTQELKIYGDPATENGHSGWRLAVLGNLVRFYVCRKIGPFCLRVHYGYKIGSPDGPYFGKVPFTAIAFSLLRWKPK